jgi:ubiquinone biosynthesis protein
MTRLFWYFQRTIKVGSVSLVLLAPLLLHRFVSPLPLARLVRWYFETCGGGVAKLGQVLAMRYDLLPTVYCDELMKLLDQMPPVSPDQIISVIEEDLGRPLSECFSEFHREPLAAASVAQVHAASLPDGTKVAVKVRRPGIERLFAVDLVNVQMVSTLLDRLGLANRINLRRLSAEFARATEAELDFRREAGNAQLLHDLMSTDDIDHYAPRVFLDLSGQRTLTMEKLEGVWVRDLIDAVSKENRARLESWAQDGICPERTAVLLMHSILTQTFRHRLFHADPHASNLIVLKGGTLGYVDFGLIGWIDEDLAAQQFRLRELIAGERIHAAYQTFLKGLEPLPVRDLSDFEAEVKACLRDYIVASKNPSARLDEKSSGLLFLRLFDAIRRAQLAVPPGTMTVYRTMLIADIVMLKLYPEIDWTPELRRFVRSEIQHQAKTRWCEHSYDGFHVGAMTFFDGIDAARQLVGWIQQRLPDLGRGLQEGLTRLEQIVILILRYLWVTSIGFAIFAVTVDTIDSRLGTEWHRLLGNDSSSRMPLAMLGLFIAFVLRRLIRGFNQPD